MNFPRFKKRMPKTKLLVATTNLKKLEELRDVLKNLDVEIVSLKDFSSIKVVEENGKTFEENAKLKAVGYASQTRLLTLGEDSGLCCEALDGAPGIYSARFSGERGNDASNNEKLLRLLTDIPEENRTAYYESAIALAAPEKLIGVVRGQVHGFIIKEHRGSGGFGYDPLFYYPNFKKTFAEIPLEQKTSVSHRGQALEKFKLLLSDYLKKT